MSTPIPLRVKIKSLAAEARIISREERRALRRLAHASPEVVPEVHASYVSLRTHRRAVVARAAREALLAYGFLRGRPYAALEPPSSSPPDFRAVWKVAERFATDRDDAAARWEAWRTAAEAHRQA
jgi:hypothetical protein